MTRSVTAAIIDEVGADGFEIGEVALDDPGPNEVRVNVEYAGACHTDWHAIEGDVPSAHYPTIGGHEGAGVVEEVGDHVDDVEVGDRVLALWVPACGSCELCLRGHQHLCDDLPEEGFRFHRNGEQVGQYLRLGTFAEQIVVREEAVVSIPEEMPLDTACIVGCGVTTGFGATAYRADVEPNDTVVVIGAGNVGLNAIQGAKRTGAGRIVAADPLEYKRETAEAFGATHTINPLERDQIKVVDDLTGGRGADVAVFSVGVGDGEMIGDAYGTLGKRGELLVTAAAPDDAIAVSPSALLRNETEIKGVYYGGASPRRLTKQIVEMYLAGEYMLDELITAKYSLAEINDAYAALLDGREIHPVLKI